MINNVTAKVRNKQTVIEKLTVDNIEVCNSRIIVNSLALHFANIGTEYADKIKPGTIGIESYIGKIKSNHQSVFLMPTTINEVRKIIEKFLNKTSCGWDGITNKLVKQLRDPLLYPLTVVINRSMVDGCFPSIMKPALVTPLFKTGKRVISNNYRSVTLLPVLSKILEKVMYHCTYSFLQSGKQFYQSQYGFREKHSCENAIQELLGNVQRVYSCYIS